MGTQQTTNQTGNQSQTGGSGFSNTNTLNFNPIAQGMYNNLISSGGSVISQFANNPLNNPFYQLGQSQTQKATSQLGANAMGVLGQNQKASGLTGNAGAGWLGAQTARTGRANQSLMSQGNLGNIMAALNRQVGAAGMGLSFSPQIMGSSGSGSSNFSSSGTSASNTTQTTGGLGTWLPQLLGAGLGAASGGLFGGMSQGGNTGGFGGGSPSYSSPTSILPQGFAGAPVGNSPFGMPLSGNTLGLSNPFAAGMMSQ